MGLENTGFAIANADELWIDPIDYKESLAEAVGTLASAGTRSLCLQHSSMPFATLDLAICRAVNFRLEERLCRRMPNLYRKETLQRFLYNGASAVEPRHAAIH